MRRFFFILAAFCLCCALPAPAARAALSDLEHVPSGFFRSDPALRAKRGNAGGFGGLEDSPPRTEKSISAFAPDGEWLVYDGNTLLRIEESNDSIIVTSDRESVAYVVSAKEPSALRMQRKDGAGAGNERRIVKAHKDILLFQHAGKTSILLRKGADMRAPGGKFHGIWRYDAQIGDAFYYGVEFNLDAKSVVEFSASTAAAAQRGENEALKVISETPKELVVQRGKNVYAFARLGKSFLACRISGPAAHGGDLLLLRADAKNVPRARQRKAGAP